MDLTITDVKIGRQQGIDRLVANHEALRYSAQFDHRVSCGFRYCMQSSGFPPGFVGCVE